MSDQAERCAVQAALRGDPMLGTAFPASRLLLVEQPGPWGRAGLLDSRFDRAIAHRLIARLDRELIRVITIRRPGRTIAGGRRRWALSDCRPGRERLVWGSFERDEELLEVNATAVLGTVGPQAAGEQPFIAAEPLYAVCAHGTHDACCAMRGRPIAAAIGRVRPGQVWECSHVGGDRFAANVLVLPLGLLYGRVVESLAEPLVDVTERGGVLEQNLRGRVGYPPEAQAAMSLVHREVPGLGVTDVRVTGSSNRSADITAVRLTVSGEPVEVLVRVEQSSKQWLTCQTEHPSSAKVYQPMSLQRVGVQGY
ncbi:MAG: sucrase ferredoxin [Nakamurella sp.]